MQPNDGANGNCLFCKYLAERCICEYYACDANVWTNTHGSSKIYCSIFFKNRLSYLTLNFSDHHQEFFRVRSIGYFKKFSSTSLDLFPKISQFDWKWNVWKLFSWFGSWILDHWALWKEIFVLVNFKQIQCSLLSPEHSILTDVKTNRNGFRSSGQDILAWRVRILEVEPFDGFSVPCELRHFRFSGYFLVVAYRPPIFWYLWVLSEDLGSRSRLPRLEVFTLELHQFFLFLQFDLFHHAL